MLSIDEIQNGVQDFRFLRKRQFLLIKSTLELSAPQHTAYDTPRVTRPRVTYSSHCVMAAKFEIKIQTAD